MATLTIEALLYQDTGTGTAETTEFQTINYVHKRVETFMYHERIIDGAAPIAYIENGQLDSWENLQIANRTYAVPANSPHQVGYRTGWHRVVGQTYTGPYNEIIATNQVFVDEQGTERPLFYKHELPANVSDVRIEIITNDGTTVVDSGYVVDLTAQRVFTNYVNYYNPDTLAYRLHFLVYTDSSGASVHTLLNPRPVAELADWEDLDLTTGLLTTQWPCFMRQQGSGGYTFTFNVVDTWYIKPWSRSLIQPLKPTLREPDDPWFLKFTNGDLQAVVNSSSRRYYVPEYDLQPFIPAKPNIFVTRGRFTRVNNTVLAASREYLNVDTDGGLHLTLYLYDSDDVLKRVLTTDTSLEGTRYANTSVLYESDKIVSWDNTGGYVHLGLDILPSYQIWGSYYYEAKEYEYIDISLNPLTNSKMRDHTVVFYLVPDVNVLDHAIHHLVVDQGGIIVECSQGPWGLGYPNLQLRDQAGAYNSSTVIGLPYISNTISDTFTTRYTAGQSNSYGYMILAECTAVDHSLVENQIVVDVREDSPLPADTDDFEDAIQKNPKILQSAFGYGEDGQTVPANKVMVIDVELSLLSDYGGTMTEEQVEEHIQESLPSSTTYVLNWVYPNARLSGYSDATGQVALSWTWEGESQTYKLYRWSTSIGARTTEDTKVSPAEATLTYNDTGLTTGDTWYYGVSITEGGVEFPVGNIISVMVS